MMPWFARMVEIVGADGDYSLASAREAFESAADPDATDDDFARALVEARATAIENEDALEPEGWHRTSVRNGGVYGHPRRLCHPSGACGANEMYLGPAAQTR